MWDVVRVAVETDDEERTVRVHDDEGDIEVGEATFRFEVTSLGSNGTDSEERNQAETGDGSTEDRNAKRIAAVEAVPRDGTLRCEAIDGRRGTEFILRRETDREADTVFAWRNSCPHEPEVRLDPGDGAIVTDDHVVCHEHGARFERGDGLCTHGPCRGKELDEIEVTARNGDVYLTDDRFEAGRLLTGKR